jgi:DNA-binding NtrC family response regulator
MTTDLPKPRPPLDPHVLVVEDEPRMRELLQRVLAGWGFDASVARSAEEASKIAEARPPDVVVLDLNLPGEGGIDWFRRLRATHPKVQGIVLTGFASIEAAKEAIHLDVVEFLTKPAHLGELEQALDRALRRLSPAQAPVLPPGVSGIDEEAGDAMEDGEGPAARTLEEVEREHILATLARQGGNRTATAAELGISRRTLYYKLEGYQKQGFSIE